MPITSENSSDGQCRLCTSTSNGQIIEIFGENGKTRKIAKKIEECLPISVSRGDCFPKAICFICAEKLEQFYDFREACLKSEVSFETNWNNADQQHNMEFSLEPECCLQEVEDEENEPVISTNGSPPRLFNAEVLPQPKKLDRGLDDFIITPISPSAFINNNHLTSTPIHSKAPKMSPKTYFNHASNQSTPQHNSIHPKVGLPNPDDYILVREEVITLGSETSKTSNNLIEFYDMNLKEDGAGNKDLGKDLDIILEQKRRHEVLPPIWDVYEKIINVVDATESKGPKRAEEVRTVVEASDISMNGSKIDSGSIENVTKDDSLAKDPVSVEDSTEKKDQTVDKETAAVLKDDDAVVLTAPKDVSIDSGKDISKEVEDGSPADGHKVVHRRYIINKEAFPCSLCGNCFLVNQGFARKTPPNGFHNQSTFENDRNYLNSHAEKMPNKFAATIHRKPLTLGPYKNDKICDSAIVITKNKPNNALMTKKFPSRIDIYKKPLSAVSLPKKILPKKVSNIIINTKHQFVSQVIKREPPPPQTPARQAEDMGSSVNSEDSVSFNDLVIKNFYCEICNKYFPRRSSLKRHQRTHVSDKIFSCQRCSKSFSRREHLSRHMMLHTDMKPFQCQVCMKQYTRKEHVERHILIHPQIPELEFRTRNFDNEQAKLYQNRDMESHINMICDSKVGILPKGVPTLERPYICELCNHGFARKEHLQRHKRRMHTVNTGKSGPMDEANKPYSCPICQKTFTRKEHLVRHNKIHIRETLLGSVQIRDLDILPSMLLMPPKSAASPEPTGSGLKVIETVSSGLKVVDVKTLQRPGLSVDRIPGLDVSLTMVEPKKESKNFLPLLPNKLDISISLVEEPATTASNGLQDRSSTPVKSEVSPASVSAPTVPPTVPPMVGTTEENLLNFLKPFNCEFCFNKRFTRKSHLVRHFKRIHPDRDVSLVTGAPETKSDKVEFNVDTFISTDDEHLCKICNKHFSRRYHLHRHLKQHIAMKSGKIKEIVDEEDKPFQCSSCHGRFTQYDGFQNHRCTGTEVGSMVLVGNLSKVGRPASEAGSSCTNSSMDTSLETRPFRRSAFVRDNAVPSTSRANLSRENRAFLGKRRLSNGSVSKLPLRRDRRRRSRLNFECEQCGDDFPTRKQLNEHVKTHDDVDDDSNTVGEEDEDGN